MSIARFSLGVFAVLMAIIGQSIAWASDDLWLLERPAIRSDGRTQTVPFEYQPLSRAQKAWNLCILYPHLKDDYWLSVNYGMYVEAKRLGVSFILNEAGGYPNETRQMEQLIHCAQSDADAIVLGTVTFDGHLAEVQQASKRKPIIAVVNDIDAEGIMAKSAVSWIEMGAAAGRFLAERHPAGAPEAGVAWFPGPSGAGWVDFIDQGFRQAIAESSVKIHGTYHGDTGREEQILLVEQALGENSSVNYLVGSGPMAEVAVSILRARGLTNEIGIVSTYMSHGVFRALQRGRILAAPTDFAVLQGRLAIEMSVRALEKNLKVPVAGPAIILMTPENIGKMRSEDSLAPAAFTPVFAWHGAPSEYSR